MAKAILVMTIAAVLGYLVWERHFSPSARIEAAYNACMKEFGASADRAKAGTEPKRNDPASAIAKGMSDALTSMVQGVSGALCGKLRDTCTNNYDGMLCQAALNRYK